MSKGLKRFFVICAAAVCLGLLLSIIGAATGGIQSMSKLGDKYRWFKAGKADMTYAHLEDGAEFDAISVKGVSDVTICSGSSDKTRIHYDENYQPPTFHVEDGVLTVDFNQKWNGVMVDLTAGDSMPALEVYVPEGRTLKYIDIDIDYGDISLEEAKAENIAIKGDCGDMTFENISAGEISIENSLGDISMYALEYDHLNVEASAGDIKGELLKSKGLHIENELGDIELQGELSGTTEITAESGDVDIETSLKEADYTVDADIEAGDLSLGESVYEYMEQHIKQGSGANLIKIVSELGNVSIGFGKQ